MGKKGQSTLEYIILITAVIVVILGFVGQKDSGFQKTLEDTLDGATSKMGTVADKWKDSVE